MGLYLNRSGNAIVGALLTDQVLNDDFHFSEQLGDSYPMGTAEITMINLDLLEGTDDRATFQCGYHGRFWR